jgi:uncharacterized protein YlxW (UPF0749 family)
MPAAESSSASTPTIAQIALSLIPALIIGMSSSYLTVQVTLAKYETEQAHQSARLTKVEGENAALRDSLNAAVAELRVLNERVKAIDNVANSQQRLESKVDALLVDNRNLSGNPPRK